VVEMRVFAGMTIEEIAEELSVSRRTVDGDWASARLWLSRELKES
jgi:DNA-directed RNA polymerase specialized sigma24 family protein